MYLSRLFVQNYRSIRSLDLCFRKGRNIIIGRNNAGKSNIVRALDLVLGEGSPTYQRSENVTPRDFYCWREMEGGKPVTRRAEELVVWCELHRDADEPLDFDSLNKCMGIEFEREAAADTAANPGSVMVLYQLDESTVCAFDRWMETHVQKRIHVMEEWQCGSFTFVPGVYEPVNKGLSNTQALNGWSPYVARVLYRRLPQQEWRDAVSIDQELGPRLCVSDCMWAWWVCSEAEQEWGMAEWDRRHADAVAASRNRV